MLTKAACIDQNKVKQLILLNIIKMLNIYLVLNITSKENVLKYITGNS